MHKWGAFSMLLVCAGTVSAVLPVDASTLYSDHVELSVISSQALDSAAKTSDG
jgi:hypothetical protein